MSPAKIKKNNPLPPPLSKIQLAKHHDPFEVLGRHPHGKQTLVRLFLPHASDVRIEGVDGEVKQITNSDFYEWVGEPDLLPDRYRISWSDQSGTPISRHDPYAFPVQLADFDIHLFNEGQHWHSYRFLGAHPYTADGIDGVLFALWAPNAKRVSVVGDFNFWDGRAHPMRSRGECGIWELFIPGIGTGILYKFELLTQSEEVLLKSDPYGNYFQFRPETACQVVPNVGYQWDDDTWIQTRTHSDWLREPVSIYEVHLGSWQRTEDGSFLNYREIAHRLADYVGELGFTHVELLPITEHPLDASWGYQTTGYYAPTSRFGSPDDFRYFVDYLHQRNIGVLLDWVPAHFPRDEHALSRFDGTALYEHEDPRMGEHRDWGTLIFNYGRNEVKNYLLSSAIYWLEEFHLDGLRVDAVASMLYLDYSRDPDDWVPNQYGGRENLEAVAFLKQLNQIAHERFPGAIIAAEESTAWPQVSRPTWLGGLGFSMKWNMGWMHDTLSYLDKDPIHRHYHHDQLTFGLLYAFTENFVLPFSHDEVVHGKRSMLDKMPGDEWQRFATLRLLYSYLFTYPGKKLLFMGNEFAQGQEWDHDSQLDWHLMERPQHQGVRLLVGELNRLYCKRPALHSADFESGGFQWIDCHDASQSVLSYLRWGTKGDFVLVVLNFTPVPRHNYRLGVPKHGHYEECFNSDSDYYGGGNVGNGGILESEAVSWMGHEQSISLTLPPLGALILQYQTDD